MLKYDFFYVKNGPSDKKCFLCGMIFFKARTCMKKEEMQRFAELVASTTAQMVVKHLRENNLVGGNDEELVDSREAARILGLSPSYLRSLNLPRVKVGNNSQGRVLYKRSDLLNNYLYAKSR